LPSKVVLSLVYRRPTPTNDEELALFLENFVLVGPKAGRGRSQGGLAGSPWRLCIFSWTTVQGRFGGQILAGQIGGWRIRSRITKGGSGRVRTTLCSQPSSGELLMGPELRDTPCTPASARGGPVTSAPRGGFAHTRDHHYRGKRKLLRYRRTTNVFTEAWRAPNGPMLGAAGSAIAGFKTSSTHYMALAPAAPADSHKRFNTESSGASAPFCSANLAGDARSRRSHTVLGEASRQHISDKYHHSDMGPNCFPEALRAPYGPVLGLLTPVQPPLGSCSSLRQSHRSNHRAFLQLLRCHEVITVAEKTRGCLLQKEWEFADPWCQT